MGQRGPQPTCKCGRCPTCRGRESARRYYNGDTALNPLRFRPPTLTLPTDPVQIGYLTGLFDGEGSLGIQNGRWRVQIAMTHYPVMEWLGSLGGTMRERAVTGNRKPCWRWLLMRQTDVRLFLTALLPYLYVKRDLAEQALAELDQVDLGWHALDVA